VALAVSVWKKLGPVSAGQLQLRNTHVLRLFTVDDLTEADIVQADTPFEGGGEHEVGDRLK
jgi:hypothetical protein